MPERFFVVGGELGAWDREACRLGVLANVVPREEDETERGGPGDCERGVRQGGGEEGGDARKLSQKKAAPARLLRQNPPIASV